jgi:hypothetical protein
MRGGSTRVTPRASFRGLRVAMIAINGGGPARCPVDRATRINGPVGQINVDLYADMENLTGDEHLSKFADDYIRRLVVTWGEGGKMAQSAACAILPPSRPDGQSSCCSSFSVSSPDRACLQPTYYEFRPRMAYSYPRLDAHSSPVQEPERTHLRREGAWCEITSALSYVRSE